MFDRYAPTFHRLGRFRATVLTWALSKSEVRRACTIWLESTYRIVRPFTTISQQGVLKKVGFKSKRSDGGPHYPRPSVQTLTVSKIFPCHLLAGSSEGFC